MKDLAGKRIIIIRSLKEAGALKRKLQDLGATVDCTPAIETRIYPLDDFTKNQLTAPDRYQAVIFSSQNGVYYFFKQIRDNGGKALLQRWQTAQHLLAAVGEKTARYLNRLLSQKVLFPKDTVGASALLTLIKQHWSNDITLPILLPTALGEAYELDSGLQSFGYKTKLLYCYQSIPYQAKDIDFSAWQSGQVDALIFFSSKSASTYHKALQSQSQLKFTCKPYIFVLGEKTYNTCNDLGLTNIMQTKVTNLSSIVEFIAKSML